ncbi:hypothetical protein CsSME_00033525 [Camellia sinensis var. sinensis]
MESKKAAYLDLCAAAMEQFKLSSEFQMVMDAAVARSLSRKGDGGAGPPNVATAELVERETKEEIIRWFQQSDYYKHEMSVYWDSGWTSFNYKVNELFPGTDFIMVRP